MNIEKIVAKLQKDIATVNVSADQLITVITSLLEILHKNGLDNEAVAALSVCGIKYEYEIE